MERLLRINEAARILGISTDWLRDAERRGVIPKARRSISGWRVYTQEDIELLKKLLAPQK
jgi:DNA-binding transcriptional MerR regulator